MINLVDVLALAKKNCEKPIQVELAYATANNFVGKIIDGYDPEVRDLALLSSKAALALCQVQNHLIKTKNYGLFIYDAYRPKRAVTYFAQWSASPPENEVELAQKKRHYPRVEKSELFSQGYLSDDSGHCYGNTVDLSLLDLQTQTFLDMGTIFDFMDKQSYSNASAEVIGNTAYEHRRILKEAMMLFGFQPYEKEYWHYSHGGIAGREHQKPLDLAITASLKGCGT